MKQRKNGFRYFELTDKFDRQLTTGNLTIGSGCALGVYVLKDGNITESEPLILVSGHIIGGI